MKRKSFARFARDFISDNPGSTTADIRDAAVTEGWDMEIPAVRYHLEIDQMTGGKIVERYDEDADIVRWYPC